MLIMHVCCLTTSCFHALAQARQKTSNNMDPSALGLHAKSRSTPLLNFGQAYTAHAMKMQCKMQQLVAAMVVWASLYCRGQIML